MATALTGDFDAVVQISGRTIYRLLATMHQNSDANGAESGSPPRVPHRLSFRIDGTKGVFWAQVGVPAIQLVPGSEMALGAKGRIVVMCPVRARFVPDVSPTKQLLSEFIHGNVRATFTIVVEPLEDGIALRVIPSDNDAEFAFESA